MWCEDKYTCLLCTCSVCVCLHAHARAHICVYSVCIYVCQANTRIPTSMG